jgi:RNA polymerase sigma-70 factor (ECF subfamily)
MAVACTVQGRAVAARPALINGSVGIVVAPRGKLLFVICLKFKEGKIAECDVIAEPERLRQLDLAVLGE